MLVFEVSACTGGPYLQEAIRAVDISVLANVPLICYLWSQKK